MASTSSDKEDSNTAIRDDTEVKHVVDQREPAENSSERQKLPRVLHSLDKLASNLDNGLDVQEHVSSARTDDQLHTDPPLQDTRPSPSDDNDWQQPNERASSDAVSSSTGDLIDEGIVDEVSSLIQRTSSFPTTCKAVTKSSQEQPSCSNGHRRRKQSEENEQPVTAKNENLKEGNKIKFSKQIAAASATTTTSVITVTNGEVSRVCRNGLAKCNDDVSSRTMFCICGKLNGVQSENDSGVCVRLHSEFDSVGMNGDNNEANDDEDDEEKEEEEDCVEVCDVRESDNEVNFIDKDEIVFESTDKPDESILFEQDDLVGENEQLNESLMVYEDEEEQDHDLENGSWSPDDSLQVKRKSDIDFDCVVEPIGKKQCLSSSANGSRLWAGNDNGTATNPSNLLETNEKTPSAINLKKRIPTKDNPPPELQTWIDIFERWGNAERLMAIDRLINMCEPTQVRHMMSVIEPQFQRDFISLLPKELALYVLSFLEPKDLLKAAQTCHYWRILAEDNLLWREKCKEANIDSRDVYCKRRSKTSGTSPSPSPWKAAYMRQHNIEMNWRYRPIRPPKVLKGHDDHVITCLQFSGSRIVSGSDDNTLKVWSAITGKCLKTLVGHTGGVWSSQMSGNIIVSGSTDRTLKVWSADTGNCLHTLYGHTSTVRCMHLHKTKVVSGSRDATLRLWDIESGQCLHVLVGHVAAVRCVQYDGRLVVSGAYDYVVKVWNPEREECLHTLQGHTSRVYSLQFDGVHVVSGSLDTSIRVWDVESGQCKHTLMGHQSLTSGMELKNNILVSGNADSTVKVWDILTGQCLQTLSGANKHNSAVTCLQFNSKFVITSSDDGTVKLWDLKTGEFIRNLVALESGGSGGVVWRIRASPTKLVCAVGSRNGTEETKLLVLNFDVDVGKA
ncbi:hypothetical protein CHUAL_012859 [Chamberlinius hualienensis]